MIILRIIFEKKADECDCHAFALIYWNQVLALVRPFTQNVVEHFSLVGDYLISPSENIGSLIENNDTFCWVSWNTSFPVLTLFKELEKIIDSDLTSSVGQ
jgi:hypothetical protein